MTQHDGLCSSVSEPLSLPEVLARNAGSLGDRTAAVCGDFRGSYRILAERVGGLARVLEAEGVEAGDRVLWMGQNCHRVLEALLASAAIGAVFCPVNWRQSPSELAFVVEDLEPKVVIWQEDTIGEQVRAARALAGERAVWVQADSDGDDGYESRLRRHGRSGAPLEELVSDPAAPVLILYTAAFEGRPNGALITQQAIFLQSLMVAMVQQLDAAYSYLNCGPLFHAGTLWQTTATFLVGGKNVFTPRADAAEICRLVAAEACNGALIAGPTMHSIVDLNHDRSYDLHSLRMPPVVPAIESVPDEWWEMVARDESPWGQRPFGYGQTEFMGLVTFNALSQEGRGRHGRPSPVVWLRVVDLEGRDAAPGQIGEIVARGPVVTPGYFNRPELNARRFRNGWYHTHDLGHFDQGGSFTFVGPMVRMIKSGVENVYPVEVEQALASHPGVQACAVIGIPDERWVQSVCAVVVAKPGATVTEEELIDHAKSRIASYKKPKQVILTEELPRKDGVVDYDELDRRYGGGGYPGQEQASFEATRP